MLQADAGSIPSHRRQRLVGMITDRDIAVRGVALGYGPDTPVSELMTSGVISAHADELSRKPPARWAKRRCAACRSSTTRAARRHRQPWGPAREADEELPVKRSKASARPGAAPPVALERDSLEHRLE